MSHPKYWEDFAAGQVYPLGSVTISEEEIIDFARQWDPQPFHVDPEAAIATPFGGLIASGWHTTCLLMRLYVDKLITGTVAHGSPGVDGLRWRKPVRPGSTLSATATVTDTAPSASRADRGTVFLRWEMADQDGDVVLEMSARALFGRRPAGPDPAGPDPAGPDPAGPDPAGPSPTEKAPPAPST